MSDDLRQDKCVRSKNFKSEENELAVSTQFETRMNAASCRCIPVRTQLLLVARKRRIDFFSFFFLLLFVFFFPFLQSFATSNGHPASSQNGNLRVEALDFVCYCKRCLCLVSNHLFLKDNCTPTTVSFLTFFFQEAGSIAKEPCVDGFSVGK